MNLQRQRMFNARPLPNPLPQSEGIAATRSANFGRPLGKFSRWFSREMANGSPSPGGEGRGEGGRFQ